MTASMLAKNISKKTLAAPGSRSSLFICAPRSLAEAMERSEPERLQALQTHLINLPSVEGMAYPIGALVLEDIMAALAYVYRETGQISQQIFTAIFQLDLRDIQTVIETDSTFPEMLRNQLKGRWVMQVFRKQGISGWNSRSDRLSAYIQCIEQIAQPPGYDDSVQGEDDTAGYYTQQDRQRMARFLFGTLGWEDQDVIRDHCVKYNVDACDQTRDFFLDVFFPDLESRFDCFRRLAGPNSLAHAKWLQILVMGTIKQMDIGRVLGGNFMRFSHTCIQIRGTELAVAVSYENKLHILRINLEDPDAPVGMKAFSISSKIAAISRGSRDSNALFNFTPKSKVAPQFKVQVKLETQLGIHPTKLAPYTDPRVGLRDPQHTCPIDENSTFVLEKMGAGWISSALHSEDSRKHCIDGVFDLGGREVRNLFADEDYRVILTDDGRLVWYELAPGILDLGDES